MIDVILSCKDSEKYIEKCINSILNQDYPYFRLFVFDDFSEDDTLRKILSFRDERMTIISSKKNIGTYAAKNFVLKNFVSSEYVALHDADDVSLPSRFSRQISSFNENGDCVSCIGTGVLEFWEMESYRPHTQSAFPVLGKTRLNLYEEKITLEDLRLSSSDKNFEKVLKTKICMNGTVMLKTESVLELGGWDGKTRFSADSDLFLRILGSGKEIRNVQEPLYKRRFHDNSLTMSPDTGLLSSARKSYNSSILPDVISCIEGKFVKRDMFYPEFNYTVIKCAE